MIASEVVFDPELSAAALIAGASQSFTRAPSPYPLETHSFAALNSTYILQGSHFVKSQFIEWIVAFWYPIASLRFVK